MGMRRDDGSWGVFPAVLGVIFLLLVGLIAYNMYSGDNTGANRANPQASNSTSTPTPNTNPTMAPKTTPTPPATPATPPANQ